MQEFRTAADDHPTFEATYPRYPFAPLVALGLALGAWLHRQQRQRAEDTGLAAPYRGRARPDASAG